MSAAWTEAAAAAEEQLALLQFELQGERGKVGEMWMWPSGWSFVRFLDSRRRTHVLDAMASYAPSSLAFAVNFSVQAEEGAARQRTLAEALAAAEQAAKKAKVRTLQPGTMIRGLPVLLSLWSWSLLDVCRRI